MSECCIQPGGKRVKEFLEGVDNFWNRTVSAFVTCRCKCHYIIIAIQWNFCQCFVKVWRVVVSVNSSVFLQLSVF